MRARLFAAWEGKSKGRDVAEIAEIAYEHCCSCCCFRKARAELKAGAQENHIMQLSYAANRMVLTHERGSTMNSRYQQGPVVIKKTSAVETET